MQALQPLLDALRDGAKSLSVNQPMKFDPIRLVDKIPNEKLRHRVLDTVLALTIPFNRWLGMRIETLEDDHVVVFSPPTRLRQNHVGGAHACSLALLGEYPAGLCVANHYGIDENRMIIAHLSIDYHKQGRGLLRAEAKAPAAWPKIDADGAWLEMKTEITDSKGDLVAVCHTRWQLKPWSAVGKGKTAVTAGKGGVGGKGTKSTKSTKSSKSATNANAATAADTAYATDSGDDGDDGASGDVAG
jgi:acyl-coenzyme A thioesterase PaaI-like protein